MAPVEKQLEFEVLETVWMDLMQHVLRDVVFMVHGGLDLLNVAEKVTADDTAQVAEWIGEGSLARPSKIEIETWSSIANKKFRFVICSPYVLVQPIS